MVTAHTDEVENIKLKRGKETKIDNTKEVDGEIFVQDEVCNGEYSSEVASNVQISYCKLCGENSDETETAILPFDE